MKGFFRGGPRGITLHKFILQLASVSYRAGVGAPGAGKDRHGWKLLLIATLAIGFCSLSFPQLRRAFHAWSGLLPEVSLPANEWRLFLGKEPGECPESAGPKSLCPASADSRALWDSPLRRGTPYWDMLAPGFQPRRYEDRHFWIGAAVTPEKLAIAHRLRANQLILGWLHSRYQIWLDGELALEGEGRNDADPIVLGLPMSRLESPEPLRVAIRLEVARNVPVLDALNEDRMGRDLGEQAVGLATRETTVGYRNLISFWGKARPLSLCLAYLVVSLIVFFFWLPARHKQEYFYLTLQALVGVAYGATRFDLFHFELGFGLNSALELILTFYGPSTYLLMALAFGRARRGFFRYGVPLLVAIPIVASLALSPGREQELFKLYTFLYYLPGAIAAGALYCFLQAYYLHERGKRGALHPVRLRRLLTFGAIALFTSALYYFMLRKLVSDHYRAYWLGYEQLPTLLSFVLLALTEYGEQERLVSRTPVSEYHRRPVPPSRIGGALLVMDLKNSERLFRAGAKLGVGGKLVESCLSHVWSAVIKEGGIVLQTEGDGLRAFFDGDKIEFPVARALRATDEISNLLALVERQFRDEGLMTATEGAIAFRGAVVVGEISPVWQEMGDTRQASWVEAGNSNPMVEVTRYMELERLIPEAAPDSVIVLPEPLAEEIAAARSGAAGKLEQRGLTLIGKHGQSYRCSAYFPAVARARVLKLVA